MTTTTTTTTTTSSTVRNTTSLTNATIPVANNNNNTTTTATTIINTTTTTTATTTANPTPININITLNLNSSTITSRAPVTTKAPTTDMMSSSSSSSSSMPSTTLTPAGTTSIAGVQTTTAANTWLGLSLSNTLLITVFTGCTALILLVLCVICCRLLCIRSRRNVVTGDRIKRQTTRQQSSNQYADPRVMENHYHSNDVTKFYATPELAYARPEIYSTFINPSFYEDVYARWKLQEQARCERNYESPHYSTYSRQLKDQMETPGFKWSANSLRVLDSYDYDTYGRIPRGKVTSSETSDREDADTVTMETSPEFTTF